MKEKKMAVCAMCRRPDVAVVDGRLVGHGVPVKGLDFSPRCAGSGMEADDSRGVLREQRELRERLGRRR